LYGSLYNGRDPERFEVKNVLDEEYASSVGITFRTEDLLYRPPRTYWVSYAMSVIKIYKEQNQE
jgi:hypothetical protein